MLRRVANRLVKPRPTRSLAASMVGSVRMPMRSKSDCSGSDMWVNEQGTLIKESQKRTRVQLTLGRSPGQLADALDDLKAAKVNLTRIQSRQDGCAYKLFVDMDGTSDEPHVATALEALRAHDPDLLVLGSRAQDVPWFPTTVQDLAMFGGKTMEMGAELEADHPGAKDAAYRERRQELASIAASCKIGEPIPHVKYNENELKAWNAVYTGLAELYPTHACEAHRRVFPLLERECGFSPNNVPQLQDISQFLTNMTGWRVRPTAGLLSARDFINALAFRVFHCTQYLRHHSSPLYTPEPDICHEVLGHIPLLADPDFADFSQELGLASLGASDEEIERLATLYWFTVEFGLCMEGGEKRAYGAGLLSSPGELAYCLTDKPKTLPLNCEEASRTPYPITEYQPLYYVASDFRAASAQVRAWAATLDRPFAVQYHYPTNTVQVLDSTDKLSRMVGSISAQLGSVQQALDRMDTKRV